MSLLFSKKRATTVASNLQKPSFKMLVALESLLRGVKRQKGFLINVFCLMKRAKESESKAEDGASISSCCVRHYVNVSACQIASFRKNKNNLTMGTIHALEAYS